MHLLRPLRWLLLSMGILAALWQPLTAQQPTFRSGTRLIVQTVVVKDQAGKPVEGLTAGDFSITGPAQFGLNTGLARTFTWGARLNLDWRIDATNVLNRVTYAGVNTMFGSPQFGLANRANAMRKLQSSLRLRF